VDDPARLAEIVASLRRLSARVPIVFPVHPRTRARLEAISTDGLRLTPPLGYLEFLSLLSGSAAAITDSGGIQEETTCLGIPCLTLRDTTERPVTLSLGTNTLVGSDLALLEAKVTEVVEGTYKTGRVPELWDGRAAERIVERF
jgi:UDP-N-acetylglucosamine 2-epimerase (non-hydrolysing)